MKRATTIMEIPQATEPEPLQSDELKDFYVPADHARDSMLSSTNVLRRMLRQTEAPLKLLFASHPGAGKSTELNRLKAEESEDFLFVSFSIDEKLDRYNITYIDLILTTMETLYEISRKEKLIRDKRVIEPVRNWLQEVVVESKLARREDLEIEAGVGLDGLLAQIVGLQAKLRSAFSLSHESAQTVRRELRPRIARLRGYCNLVIAEITDRLAKQNRRLVIVVEDTDKLDVAVAREMFVEHTGILADLSASVIYTVPLFLIHSPDRKRLESRFDKLVLPMIKTHTPQGQRVTEGWETLREIVVRRLDVDSLIDDEALDLAIEKTGGIVRDLLNVIRDASNIAYDQKVARISIQTIRYTLDQLKADYRTSVYGESGTETSTKRLYERMVEIAQATNKQVPVDEALILLLHTQAVVEYNGRGWYDLHPLMREALYEMGYLDGLAS